MTDDTTSAVREAISAHFHALRHDPAHHLGLGDIRLTMGQQEEILEMLTTPPEAEAGAGEALRLPQDPTPAMIEAGAARLMSYEGDSRWPDSFTPLQQAAARQDAERVWLSMVAATPPEADAELARKDERIAALEACLRERDGGDHDPHCRIWTSGWQKKADKFCTCGHVEARALLEKKP